MPGALWIIFREACSKSIADHVPRLGASLAFYMTFSLAPLVVVIVGIAGTVFGRKAAEGRFITEVGSFIGEDTAASLQSLVSAADHQGSGWWASAIGGVVILVGAIGLFCEIQDALNTVLEVPCRPISGLWSMVRSRLLSFLLVLGAAFLLLVSLALSAFANAADQLFRGVDGSVWADSIFLHIVPTYVSFAVVVALFAMIYWLLPDANIAWRDVWFGAIVASALFGIGKSLMGLYLGQTAFTSLYGAAASLVVLMMWNYYTAQIFLFGAELTKASSHRRKAGLNAFESLGMCDNNRP